MPTIIFPKNRKLCAFEIFQLIFPLPSRIITLYHKRKGGVRMRIRKKALGDKNLIGARIEAARRTRGMKQKELLAQLQVRGVDPQRLRPLQSSKGSCAS